MLLSSIDQDILAAGNAGVEVVAGTEADGSLPDVGDVVQLGTRESLVYDGLRNPTLDIIRVMIKSSRGLPVPTLRSVSRSHWKRHISRSPSTGLMAQQPGPFSPLTFLC